MPRGTNQTVHDGAALPVLSQTDWTVSAPAACAVRRQLRSSDAWESTESAHWERRAVLLPVSVWQPRVTHLATRRHKLIIYRIR